jgi:hypothetical protein
MAPTGRMTNVAPGKGGIERDPQTLGNHRFFAGSRAEMLRRCLTLSSTVERAGSVVRLRVRLEALASQVGHRVPTGFVDRHLVVVIEGQDSSGQRLDPLDGPRLPSPAGRELEGQPGRLYAKLLSDFDGHAPAPFWRARPECADTRLAPGAVDDSTYPFPASAQSVRVRLLYRPFWPSVAEAKGWPDDTIVLIDRRVKVQ